jgi:hypothetical protein
VVADHEYNAAGGQRLSMNVVAELGEDLHEMPTGARFGN